VWIEITYPRPDVFHVDEAEHFGFRVPEKKLKDTDAAVPAGSYNLRSYHESESLVRTTEHVKRQRWLMASIRRDTVVVHE
jgi:hypothetical protein